MILGIGTDIVDVQRITRTLEERGARFVDRCYAPDEQDAAQTRNEEDRAAFFAKRWAAKEACAKALGLGIRDGIFLKDIAVVNDPAGRPLLRLTGGARQRLDSITPPGMTAALHLSLSDEPPMALAFVTITAEKQVPAL